MREINRLSVQQWLRSAIPDSQQPISPIGFLFLKLPPPPCAVLLVDYSTDHMIEWFCIQCLINRYLALNHMSITYCMSAVKWVMLDNKCSIDVLMLKPQYTQHQTSGVVWTVTTYDWLILVWDALAYYDRIFHRFPGPPSWPKVWSSLSIGFQIVWEFATYIAFA